MEAEEEGGSELGVTKKRKKKKQLAADEEEVGPDDDAEEEVEPAPLKKKKRKTPEEAASNATHEEDPVPKTGKKKKKQAAEPEQDEEAWTPSWRPGKGKGRGPGGKGSGKAAEPTEEEVANCRKVCAASLPLWVEKAHIWKHFSKCGEIEGVFLLRDQWTWESRGVAFITFYERSSVAAALALDKTDFGGQKIRVNLAIDKQAPPGKGQAKGSVSKSAQGTGPNYYSMGKGKDGKGKGKAAPSFAPALADKPEGCTGVMVRSLSFDVTEEDLREAFASCAGGTTRVRLLMDKQSGQSKGKAFLDFADQSGVDEAIKLAGTSLKGRKLIVEYAKPLS